MSNFSEGIKDFFYDSIDYIMIIVIIAIMGSVIVWRLDILFSDDNIDKIAISEMDKPLSDNNESSNSIIDTEENEIIKISETDTNTEETTKEEQTSTQEKITKIIEVKIPDRTLAPTIADILIQKNLISSKSDFLRKAQELKLDTKLKSGTFKIKENSSLETIIKIIARSK